MEKCTREGDMGNSGLEELFKVDSNCQLDNVSWSHELAYAVSLLCRTECKEISISPL